MIFDAVYNVNFEEVKRIVTDNPNCVHIKDGWGWTPLDLAIEYGHLETVKYLWEMGGRPNLDIYRDGKWITSVHIAASRGYIEILKWIFKEKEVLPLDVLNIKNTRKETLLDAAIARGRLETVKFLWEMSGRPNLDAYCDGKNTPVHFAARYGKIETLKWFLEKGFLPWRSVLNIKTKNEWTPLDVAIKNGQLEMAKFLFEEGAQPNLEIYRDGFFTPVHHAAQDVGCNGTFETLKWVFENKVLPLNILNVKAHNEWTPLNCATFGGKWKTKALFRRLLHLDPVFLAMQRAKRDYHQRCALRRLPDELLDMVVDEVAARLHLKVV